MNKSKLLIGISMMAAIVISIVFLSLAWFDAPITAVRTDPTALKAESMTTFTLGEVQTSQDLGKYRGETGLAYYRYTTERDNPLLDYVYYDDGVYESHVTVDQLLARVNIYYYPYTVAEPENLDTNDATRLFWNDSTDTNNRRLVPASAEQIAMANGLLIVDEDTYVRPTVAEVRRGQDLVYYEDEEYRTATTADIALRTNMFFASSGMRRATSAQLEAGLNLFFRNQEDEEVYYTVATDEQIDAATRVLYYNQSYFPMATLDQVESRLGLFYGQTETIATAEQLNNNPAMIYCKQGEDYVRATSEQIAEGYALFYKDKGVKLTRDFEYVHFEAYNQTTYVYHWQQGNLINTTKTHYQEYRGTVTDVVKNFTDTSVNKNNSAKVIVKMLTNSSKTNPSKTVNIEINNISYSATDQGNGVYTISKKQTVNEQTQYNTYTITVADMVNDKTADYTDYKLDEKNGTYVMYYRTDAKTGNKTIIYSKNNTILYDDRYANTTITFNGNTVTEGGKTYWGTVTVTQDGDSVSRDCYDFSYTNEAKTAYRAMCEDYTVVKTVEGEYSIYLRKTGQAKFSTEAGSNLSVNLTTRKAYAYIDSAADMEDEAYVMGKQFNVMFPSGGKDHYVRIVSDKLGIIPLHSDAADALAARPGAVAEDVYYTYVDNEGEDFGLDLAREGEGTAHEMVYVTNYDHSRQTVVDTTYVAYDSESSGYFSYVTVKGIALYVLQDTEYVLAHTGITGAGNLTQLQQSIQNNEIHLYIKNGTSYLEYSEYKYGAMTYDTQTSTGKTLYYHGVYPVATNAQIAQGVEIYYYDDSQQAFALATADMRHASGLLYYSALGDGSDCEVATSARISSGNNLYYADGDNYVAITKEDIETYRRELYCHAPASAEDVDAGVGLFYYDSSDGLYRSATVDMKRASGTLYYSALGDGSDCEGNVADSYQIEAGDNLYYFNGTSYVAISTEIVAANRTTLYKILYTAATREQVLRMQDLHTATIVNIVYAMVTDNQGNYQRGRMLYSVGSGNSISTAKRTLYSLSESDFYSNFYVEVTLYDDAEDILVGKFYIDSQGYLVRTYGDTERYVMEATNQNKLYRCVVVVYFIDGNTYRNLHSDALHYTYDYSAGVYQVSSSNGSLVRAFEFSDNKYIGTNFLVRLDVVATDVEE